jgi:DNA topoisomerase-1
MTRRAGRAPRNSRSLFVKTAARVRAQPAVAASAAGLRYVRDDGPGIRRQRRGRGFRYLDADGRAIRRPAILARIRALAIPPAWTDVWICLHAHAHLQATGRDARGRKQYRYHAQWRSVRDRAKYEQLPAFGQTLPLVRERVERDLSLRGLPRDKVLATVVRLLEATLIRVGNEEYVRANHSFGLTTLRDSHVDVTGSRIAFRFRGKAGKRHRVSIADRRLSRIVKRCQELPGQVLFQYQDDDGTRRSVGSEDVNAYLKEITGQEFTAKDFRTWAATVLAASALAAREAGGSRRARSRTVMRAIECVAARLGNTPSICRKSYVHPSVIAFFLDGSLAGRMRGPAQREAAATSRLPPEEAAVLELLAQRVVA